MEKVFVTGAGGHLGSILCEQLIKSGYKVRAFVRNSNNLSLFHKNCEIFIGDILELSTLSTALKGCDTLFHTAAIYSYGKNLQMEKTAIQGTENVLMEAYKNRISKIVITSSVATIGSSYEQNIILNETFYNTDPVSDYEISKIKMEQKVIELMKKYKLPLVIINPSTILGRNDYKPTPSNQQIKNVINQATKYGCIFYYPGGHSYADVEDIATGHILAAQKGKIGERYILSGTNVTTYQFYEFLTKLHGIKTPKIPLKKPLIYMMGLGCEVLHKCFKVPFVLNRTHVKLIERYSWYDCSKAKNEIGYSHIPFEEVIRRSYQWLLNIGLIDKIIR